MKYLMDLWLICISEKVDKIHNNTCDLKKEINEIVDYICDKVNEVKD